MTGGQAAADRAVKRKWLCLCMLHSSDILLTHKCTKLHLCTDFNSSTRVAVYAGCIYVLTEYLNYTRRGIKIGTQMQFVCIFLHIC